MAGSLAGYRSRHSAGLIAGPVAYLAVLGRATADLTVTSGAGAAHRRPVARPDRRTGELSPGPWRPAEAG